MPICHAPTMSWNSILVQPATMNDGRQDENKLHQVWWYEELFVLSHPSLHVCILLAEQSFASLIQHDGVRGASELEHRHEARRLQHRFRASPENYLAALEEKLIKKSLLT
jgi:hypothetical protein